ncbi:hypothetical protein MES4922_160156 [Mesorhizobium ventifaucium]|uniref:Secreted protein n=1 Tax=Mesorhizobium ventifaucium TaxID=666020 RepID=A0ABM9DIC9_9HYPH|nr:hypothetical protein MES4922_160156 [Mesorhizobium ventifaucium]
MRYFLVGATCAETQSGTSLLAGAFVHSRRKIGENVRTSVKLANNADATNGERRSHERLYRLTQCCRQVATFGKRVA